MPELDLATRTQTAAADGSAAHVTGGRTIVPPPDPAGRPSGGRRLSHRRRRGRDLLGLYGHHACPAARTTSSRPDRSCPGPADRRLSLRVATLDVPDPSVRSQLFGSTAGLVGASVSARRSRRAPLWRRARSSVRGGAPGTRELSISLDPEDRAVGGTLKPGEFVDVFSAFGREPRAPPW